MNNENKKESKELFHGSPCLFDEFDYNKIGVNGTNEGKGFYFTDTRRIAEGYAEKGYLYTVLWKGKKPLSDKKVTISVEQFKRFILKLDENLNYLCNWGDKNFDGVTALLNQVIENEYYVAESDSELIGSIINATGNHEATLKILYSMFGYDSIEIDSPEWGKGQVIYVALIKSAFEIIKVEKL